MFKTSVCPGSSGAPAEANNHFTARGKHAAIFTPCPQASRFSAGSLRADISQRSATASNERPESLSCRSTAAFTVGSIICAYVQFQYRILGVSDVIGGGLGESRGGEDAMCGLRFAWTKVLEVIETGMDARELSG